GLAHRVLVALALLLAITVAQAETSDASVRSFVERFVTAVGNSDIDAFMACFAQDATAFFPSATNAERRTGIAAIRAGVAPTFAQAHGRRVVHANDLVITMSGAMAVASFDAGEGALHARRTLVLRKDGESWSIVHLHASNLALLPESGSR